MLFIVTLLSILTWTTGTEIFKERNNHKPKALNRQEINTFANLSNLYHMNEILDNICIERIVGTRAHENVKEYIANSMQNLGWDVEIDEFEDYAPGFGILSFSNVIARLNPNAKRYLTLACHYDSKYIEGIQFVGAIDSAVPCAQLINTAMVMHKQLQPYNNADLSLMFIFFDGEEAFEEWGPKDSIYGARHLANKWSKRNLGNNMSELDKIDLLVLLDLIGGPNPRFHDYSTNKKRWYNLLLKAETDLVRLGLMKVNSYQKYFEPYSSLSHIEDDHIPFLRKNVPVLHIIPYRFPNNWHTEHDNRSNLDLEATEDINKILRLFIASYLHINV